LGYAANVFVYCSTSRGGLHEEGLVVPLARGVRLPRASLSGEAAFANDKVALRFTAEPEARHVFVDWPSFHDGRGSRGINLAVPPGHESRTRHPPRGASTTTPRSTACRPKGGVQCSDWVEELRPDACRARLDWGGVWEYRISELGQRVGLCRMADGGLNLGRGFGD
jgi:hypothetical protein